MVSKYPEFKGDMPTNPSLTEVFNKSKLRYCSLEISCNKPVPYEMIDKMKIKFCSVIWMGNYEIPPEEIGSIILAKDLISRGFTVLLHITARNNTKTSVRKVLDYAKFIGVKNLLCLRGGSPECHLDESSYEFPHTPDLIKFIKTNYGDYFDLCVAGFPYKHPDSKNMEEDMKFLKQKNDAGAKFIITQACFSYDIYKKFHNLVRKNKINMQIIPGVYIIHSVVDFCLLKRLCKVPDDDPVVDFVKRNKNEDDVISAFGVKLSTEIIGKLMKDEDFLPPHIFSMNEFDSVDTFLKNLTQQK